MNKENKICAKRSAFLTFLVLILALLCIYGIYCNKYYISIICFVFFISFLLYACINKYKHLFIIFLIAFFIFTGYSFLIFNSIKNININENELYNITGKVTTSYSENENCTSFILYNCIIKNSQNKTLYKNKDIRITYFDEFYTPSAGDILSINTNLKKEKICNYGKFNHYNLPYNIHLSATISGSQINIIKNDKSLKDFVHLKVKNAFINNMDIKTASLAYAVTFGDKSLMFDSLMDGFRYSGLAHILAVSGLHTTIIFMLLAFLLSKIKILNRITKVIIISILLIFYAYLCDFSPSIIRATIMCIIAYFTLCTKYKNDFLNTLGISGILILLFNPLDLFNIGFLLSFACIFGIALFANNITNKLNFIKIKSIKSTIALTTSTQIATLPFLSYFFGYFTFISFIANVILLPLFIFLFSFIIIGAFISIIFTPAIYLNMLSNILEIFINLSVYISNIDFLIIPLCKIAVIGILAYLILMFSISNRFFFKKSTKIILNCILIVIIATSCILSSIPKTTQNCSFSVIDTNNRTHYFKIDNSFTLINPFTNSATLQKTKNTLNQLNEYHIKHLIVIDKPHIKIDYLKQFIMDYNILNTYIPYYLYDNNSALIQLLEKYTNLIIMQDMQEFNIGTDSKFIQKTENSGYFKYYIDKKQYLIDS